LVNAITCSTNEPPTVDDVAVVDDVAEDVVVDVVGFTVVVVVVVDGLLVVVVGCTVIDVVDVDGLLVVVVGCTVIDVVEVVVDVVGRTVVDVVGRVRVGRVRHGRWLRRTARADVDETAAGAVVDVVVAAATGTRAATAAAPPARTALPVRAIALSPDVASPASCTPATPMTAASGSASASETRRDGNGGSVRNDGSLSAGRREGIRCLEVT
jgi:hypothetical protein